MGFFGGGGVACFGWLVFECVITKNIKVIEQLGFGRMVALCETIFRATKQK